jgi:hypothetical protein
MPTRREVNNQTTRTGEEKAKKNHREPPGREMQKTKVEGRT